MFQQKEGWVLFFISPLPARLCFCPCPFVGLYVSRITRNLSNATDTINFWSRSGWREGSCKSFSPSLTLRERVSFCMGSRARILKKNLIYLRGSILIWSSWFKPILFDIWYWIVLMKGYCWALAEGCTILCAILVLWLIWDSYTSLVSILTCLLVCWASFVFLLGITENESLSMDSSSLNRLEFNWITESVVLFLNVDLTAWMETPEWNGAIANIISNTCAFSIVTSQNARCEKVLVCYFCSIA